MNAPAKQASTVVTQLVITNKYGIVHRMSHDEWDRMGWLSCGTVRAAEPDNRRAVRPVQALVFKLPHCDTCWPNVEAYSRFIGRRGARDVRS